MHLKQYNDHTDQKQVVHNMLTSVMSIVLKIKSDGRGYEHVMENTTQYLWIIGRGCNMF